MPHYPGKKSDFLRGNLFQIFPLVLPEDSEVARTRKRRECGLHKKSLWLAFLSLSDQIKSKSINFLFRNFHSFVFNPIPAASTLSPQLQPYPRSFNPIPSASTLSPQLQSYPISFNPIPASSKWIELLAFSHTFKTVTWWSIGKPNCFLVFASNIFNTFLKIPQWI